MGRRCSGLKDLFMGGKKKPSSEGLGVRATYEGGLWIRVPVREKG